MSYGALPPKQGLYDPANEHDACGVGFVADIKGRKSHEIIEQGLTILERLTHRGAVGADPKAGDGAGILLQIPDAFLRKAVTFELPNTGDYAVGMLFLPQNGESRGEAEALIETIVAAEGQKLLGWRDVPVNNADLGESVIPTEPVIRQVFVGSNCAGQDAFERKLFVIRKQIENRVRESQLEGKESFYFTSLSSRTIKDPELVSALALVHQRFSTNTFPTWDLAHPFRMIAHNGEINTLRGNVNWMAAKDLAPDSRGTVRLRLLRQRPRIAGDGRLLHGPRHDAADSRGVERQRSHGPAAAGLLRVPCRAHGALGRARRGGLH